MASYCWGNRYQPHRIIVEANDHVIVEIDGDRKQIPHHSIQGRIDSGQRVRVLSSGGGWRIGVVLDGDRLVVRFDLGREREIFDAKWMHVIGNKPSAIIDNQVESITTKQTCRYCSKPATLFCDGRIKSKGWKTCDRPLCREHGKHVGNSFYCDRSKPSNSEVDTVDLCPDCVQAQCPQKPKPTTVP